MAKLEIRDFKMIGMIDDSSVFDEIKLDITITSQEELKRLVKFLSSGVLEQEDEPLENRSMIIAFDPTKLIGFYEMRSRGRKTLNFDVDIFLGLLGRKLINKISNRDKKFAELAKCEILSCLLIHHMENVYKSANVVSGDYDMQEGDYKNIHKMIKRELKRLGKKVREQSVSSNTVKIIVGSVKLEISHSLLKLTTHVFKNLNVYTEIAKYKF